MSKTIGPGRPTYGQALEAIGWYFDRNRYSGIFVAEVDDGYIGKARPTSGGAELYADAFSFPYADVYDLIVAAAAGGSTLPESPSPLCPAGYNVFMGALGDMYDRDGATYVSLLEVTDGFVVGYTMPAAHGREVENRRVLIDRAGIEEIMSRA